MSMLVSMRTWVASSHGGATFVLLQPPHRVACTHTSTYGVAMSTTSNLYRTCIAGAITIWASFLMIAGIAADWYPPIMIGASIMSTPFLLLAVATLFAANMTGERS